MKECKIARSLVLALVILASTAWRGQCQVNVLTRSNDSQRTGLNPSETILSPLNVNKTQFGRFCTAPTDGQIYAQPLVVTGVPITLGGVTQQYNVVYVATQNDSVYAFDADDCNQLLQVNLATPYGEVAVPCASVGGGKCGTIAPTVGILGTPVIEATTSASGTTGTLFVVAQSMAGSGTSATYYHRIHALDITTLQDVVPASIISGISGTSMFTSVNHLQRPGLLLLPHVGPGGDSLVYAGFSLMDGAGGLPNGWVFSYDATNLKLFRAFSTTSRGDGGGVWQGGQGIAAGRASAEDPNIYIYIATGDGLLDANTGGSDYGDSFLRLPTNLVPITPPSASTYFSPFNQSCLYSNDLDFGSGGVVLLPNPLVPGHYLAVVGSKDGNIYVMDRGAPGGYDGISNTNLQTIPNSGTSTTCSPTTGFYRNSPAFWNGSLYYGAVPVSFSLTRGKESQETLVSGGGLMRYLVRGSCTPGPICTPAVAASTTNIGYAPTPSVSSNLSTNGIVWVISKLDAKPSGGKAAILYAFDAIHLAELYGSNQCTNDTAGTATKFSVPTIANGKVYVGTQTELDVYGLIAGKTCQ